MNKIAFVLAASVLSATAAFAEGEAPAADAATTEAPAAEAATTEATAPVVADTDANGTFSLTEVQAVYAAVTEEAFKAADTDASGELSAEELQAAVDAGAFVAA